MNFGTDILVVDGEVMWNGDDIATVSGTENVLQQSYLRCTTDLGESVFFSDYGTLINSWAAKPYTPETKQQVETEARVTLLRVGDASGIGWIEEILDCQYLLLTVDGQQVKTLYAKLKIRDESEPRDISINLGGVADG